MRKNGFVGAIVLAIIIFGGVILGFSCTSRVPTGYVGVVYNMNGGVDGEVLSQGWHLVAPTKKVTTYSIGLEQSYLTSEEKGDSPNDESFSIPTSDGKTVRVNSLTDLTKSVLLKHLRLSRASLANRSRIHLSSLRLSLGHRKSPPITQSRISSVTSARRSTPSWTPICATSLICMALLSTR